MQLLIKKLKHFDSKISLPSFQSEEAAGADLCACFENRKGLSIEPWERVLIPTGISLSFPAGYEAQIRPRSGMSLKTPLIIPNSPGTIDSDYRGEVKIIVVNMSNEPFFIEHGIRAAQIVFNKVERPNVRVVDSLDSTVRGESGFGSTGAT